MALAGKGALVKVTGASVAFSSESMATSDNLEYTLASTSLADKPWDPVSAITVRTTNGSTVTGYTVNRLKGSITFASTASRTLKATGEYRTLSTVSKAHEFTINVTKNLVDTPFFGSSYTPRLAGLGDVSGTMARWYNSNQYFSDLLASSSDEQPIVIEFYADSSTTYTVRTWGIVNQAQLQSVVDGAVDEPVAYEGAADADDRTYTFS